MTLNIFDYVGLAILLVIGLWVLGKDVLAIIADPRPVVAMALICVAGGIVGTLLFLAMR